MTTLSESKAKNTHKLTEKLLYELKRIIVGQDYLLERLIVALLAQGHVLVEGAPGLAKTLSLKCLAEALTVDFSRIQFTPDLLPADLIGTRVYNPNEGQFYTELGPVISNFVLADEINRAPSKVQSALLQAMEERQATIGRQTFQLRAPFMVMATQNPIEQEGTYPLPEAQMDRFLFKLVISYPNEREELVILERMTNNSLPTLNKILAAKDILALSKSCEQAYLDPTVAGYIVDIVQATRHPDNPYLQFGASPRGSLALAKSSKALALIRGRHYVVPEDVQDLIHDCLRHRIILSYEGMAADMTPDKVLDQIKDSIPSPQLIIEEVLAA